VVHVSNILYYNVFIFYLVFFFIITNTNRTFGNLCNLSQVVLQWLAFLYGLTNGMCRFLWGWLLDKFNFKKLMFAILTMEFTVACSIYYIAYNPILYIFENLLIALCVGGTFVMLIPCFSHIFGVKNGPKIYGLTGILVGLSSMIGPIVSELIVKTKVDYLKLYLIGGGFVFVNIIVCLLFEEKPYVYTNTKKIEE
jgi:MFS family permease